MNTFTEKNLTYTESLSDDDSHATSYDAIKHELDKQWNLEKDEFIKTYYLKINLDLEHMSGVNGTIIRNNSELINTIPSEGKTIGKNIVKEVREEGLDKFYTIPSYSKKCINNVFELYDKSKFDLIVEPSAGNGSFFNQLECDNKIGIDISSENANIIKMDFFDYMPGLHINNILVIGNPPFGKISSIAVKFFNQSTSSSISIIKFVLELLIIWIL